MTIGDIKKIAKNSVYISDDTEIVSSTGDGGHVRIVSACSAQVNGNNLKLYEFQSGGIRRMSKL